MSTRLRSLYQLIFRTACMTSAAFAVLLLAAVLGLLLWRGISALDLNFFTQLPAAPGEAGGGLRHAILGSLQLVGLAALLGLPVGLLTGIYLSEYGQGWLANLIRNAADLLNGLPSIVLGLFAYTVIVQPTRQFSWLAGSVALSLLVIPSVQRATEDFLRLTPLSLREAAWGLGARQWRTIATVLLPAASRGILTGALLAIARIFGETAPLLFTSFGNRFPASSLWDPVASLPGVIFAYAISPHEDWRRQAWAAALVLIAIILFLNLTARKWIRP